MRDSPMFTSSTSGGLWYLKTTCILALHPWNVNTHQLRGARGGLSSCIELASGFSSDDELGKKPYIEL
ncbi:hypothetical protein N7499_005401 [Penicillium canescens]|uniref:Uncharacterized protein n=1 Tax=Penicillium canescens TaxID=5083 RepID=A0AAD6N3Q2_PENCN|nr:uncharacterized protein N7446_004090 [Penicillium canescens]KAJ6009179.1 hypothetical protein N7522_004195 [Penicillium canescens]KAJ6027312.1 hypothetical protein N7460_012129 [Penicillium canescens]KAJ6040595.1 hypothetical protein N7444_009500 [Penicillium canescens]KAJ6067053.1 hypothetical protein N7446_004090 [Penicillium canescens]KAJ6085772.1 hypothetical protein N7499_005401 [Penicillium canescens]